MKKLWGILLSLAILTTAMPVCSFAETPEAGANGTFSLFVGLQEPAINTTNHDILAWSEAQKQTGIQIEFVHGGGENLNLMIASNDLTDAIYQFWPDFSGGAQGALDNGTIIPLPKEMLAKAAPHYWAYLHAWPELIKMMTTDNGTHFQVGGVMTWEQEESLGATPVLQRAPFYESWMGLILRTDLLEKTGLSVPVTVDDWTQVLRAFKAMDIASPMSATVSNLKTSNAFAGAFGIAHGLYQDAEGIAHYGPMEEGYQTYLTLLHQWYTEGLLDADYAALDGNMARAKLISGESAATIGTGGWIGISYESAHELTPDTDYYLKAIAHPTLDAQHLIAPYGQRAYPYIGGIAITPACKDPEVVLNFFDYYWTDEGSVTANWGVEGVSYERNENGLPVFSEKLAQN
ncbi:MAG: extracellular solute-binding protein, partial [Clostridia bacterium]